MGLTSTLYTGLTGLTVNQTRLNVIGNNIANVNTTAFKASRAEAKPQFYVTDTAGATPGEAFGGSNPAQRGLGAAVGAITQDFTTGSLATTGRDTDMAIEGDGFFVVEAGQNQMFTRDGTFDLNSNNDLVSSNGDFVMGYGIDTDFNVDTTSLQKINIPLGKMTIVRATTATGFTGNLNAAGEQSTSASVLQGAAMLDSLGATPDDTTALTDLRAAADVSGPALFTTGQVIALDAVRGATTDSLIDPENNMQFVVGTDGNTLGDLMDFMQSSLGIDTSAETAAVAPAGFTPGISIAAGSGTDPTGSVRLNVTGNVGTENSLEIRGGLPFSMDQVTAATGESARTAVTVYDSLGNPLSLDVTFVLEDKNDTGTTWRFFTGSSGDSDFEEYDGANDAGRLLGSGTLTFNSDGKLTATTGNNVSISRSNTGADPTLNIALEFDNMQSLSDSGATTVAADPRDPDAGFPTQTLDGFSVGEDGKIEGSFTNGTKRTLGQIAIAQFDNPEGLLNLGSNNYITGASSGQPIITAPLALGAGSVQQGRLEESNVDISKEFINMIIMSTGFSAASRVITTSDQMMQELLSTTR